MKLTGSTVRKLTTFSQSRTRLASSSVLLNEYSTQFRQKLKPLCLNSWQIFSQSSLLLLNTQHFWKCGHRTRMACEKRAQTTDLSTLKNVSDSEETLLRKKEFNLKHVNKFQ